MINDIKKKFHVVQEMKKGILKRAESYSAMKRTLLYQEFETVTYKKSYVDTIHLELCILLCV